MRLFLFSGMHYFFSDAHLGLGSQDDRREREHSVVRFLEFVGGQTPDSLWIVGDLFDYWFEYRTVIPRDFVRTLGAIAALTDAGIRVEYLIGNHDFGHHDFFEQELGVILHPHDVTRDLSGRHVLLSHGDGKLLNDTGYLILKKVLRSRSTNALWRFLHPDIGIGIASRASRKSRDHTSSRYNGETPPGEEDGLQLFAEEAIRSQGIDLVIMGHTHTPRKIAIDNGTYVNLGNWMGKRKTYLQMDENNLELMNFEG